MAPIAPFPLTVCGLDELADVGTRRPSHVLSILDPDWPVPEAFGAFGEHEKLELRFHDIIEDQPGMPGPTQDHIDALLGFGRDLMAEPPAQAHLLVHCHAGVSRSTASMALILAQAQPEVPAEAILAEVLRIRDKAWPNLRMLELGDRTLGRGGSLPEAAHALYARQVERRPHLWAYMDGAGRQRELARIPRPAEAAAHPPA